MWENQCKVAVSGVGFSKVSRTADTALAAHALIAVKEAVADSGGRSVAQPAIILFHNETVRL